jgi:hypothetical protein
MGNPDRRLENQAGPARSSQKADLARKVPLGPFTPLYADTLGALTDLPAKSC